MDRGKRERVLERSTRTHQCSSLEQYWPRPLELRVKIEIVRKSSGTRDYGGRELDVLATLPFKETLFVWTYFTLAHFKTHLCCFNWCVFYGLRNTW